jgi:hypothetical protein
MQDILCRLEEQKWDWTTNAIKEFNGGFIRHDPSQFGKDRVLVGVYGPTQVGKTTFILKLLGIKEEYFSSLSQALRGKRKAGKSATITCTIYEESSDDDYVITLPDKTERKVQTFEQLEDAMASVREEIEKSGAYSLEPLKIGLSNTLFKKAEIDKRKREISIVDLPGDDSKDKVEMVHVERVLKEYLPRCKVTILMEIAGQMTTLTQLNREFVRDWPVLPYHFRIVLTRSVTSSSVVKKVENREIGTTNDYQRFYESELARYNDQRNVKTKIYPLEFGESWSELQSLNSSLFNKASIWVEDIFSRLVEDLTSIYSPENEIRQLKDLDGYILKRSKDEEDQFVFLKKKIVDELELIEDKQASLRSAICTISKRLSECKNEKKGLKKRNVEIDHLISIPPWEDRPRSSKKTSDLDSEFYYIQDQMKESFEAEVRKFAKEMKTTALLFNRRLKEFTFDFQESHLSLTSEYRLETYLSKKNFNVDCFRVELRLEECLKENQDRLNEAVNSYLKEMSGTLDQVILDLRNKREALNEEKKQANVQHKELSGQLEMINRKIEQAHEEWERDLARSQKLTLYLQKAFLEQFSSYVNLMNKEEAAPEEKWFYHQYLNIMRNQAEGIIQGDF